MKFSKFAVAALFAAGFVGVPAGLAMADTREKDDPIIIQCLHEYTDETGYKCIETSPEDELFIYPPVEEESSGQDEGDVDEKPIYSCWINEDGTDICTKEEISIYPPVEEESSGQDEGDVDEKPIYSCWINEDGTDICTKEESSGQDEGDVDLKPTASCWTNEDGVEFCTRSAMVPMSATLDDTPVETSECSVTTDEQGVSSEVCMKAVPFSGTPEEDDGVAYLEDGPVDENLMYQSYVTKTLAAPADPTVSNAVAIFGVLVGALWALVIVMNRRKEAK